MSSLHRRSAGVVAPAFGTALLVLTTMFTGVIAGADRAGAATASMPLAPTMGSAANYAVLAGTTVTNTGGSVLRGSLGLSPGTSITGFPPGQVLAPAGTDQTNAAAALAQSDLTNAYTNAHGRAVNATTAADLTGLTLQGGVYAALSKGALGLTGTLTLDGAGNANSVFVFQTDSQLTTASNSTVNLINGAQECNVFWQVGSSATLGSGSSFTGNILALTSITVNSGVTVRGRALARNGAVTLANDVFNQPTCAGSLPDTNYPIPTGALFVAPSGSNTNAGTQAAPFATLAKAVSVATSGATIVLRGGTYRESINSIFKKATIQAYPHEQPWMDGRQVVAGFTASGSAWARTGWNPGLCQNCFDPNAILPTAPAAGLPDMVFVDGSPLAQVTTLGALVPGAFYVDPTNHVLYLGTNPSGHVVEAAVLAKAVEFATTGATGSMVRGIGFIGYGTSYNSGSNGAMVIDGSPNVTFENDTFAWAATRALAIVSTGAVVRGSTFLYNGFQGMVANIATGLVIDSSRFAYSNQEHFVYGWSSVAGAAGVKITSTSNVTVRDSIFDNNAASGLWFDMSSQGLTIVRNLVQKNLWDGISVELSDTALVASNVLTDNDGLGLKISGATRTRVWNNTMANNATAQLGVNEDKRSNPDATERAAGITWDTANITIQNNILASDDGRATLPLVHTWDGNSPKQVGATQMISAMDNSVYARASTTKPTYVDYWVTLTGPNYATNYSTLAQFQTGTNKELAGIERVNYAVSPLFVAETTGNYRLVPGSPAHLNGAVLPSDIAAAVGVTVGVAVDRGALVWPGSTPVTNPLLPMPVYGLWNHTTGDRIYTTSVAEVTALVAAGYSSLSVVFDAASAPASGLVPVYRLKGLSANHLYSRWAGERDSLVAAGWILEGTAFYAPTSTMTGLLRVYRYFDLATNDHYLSTSATPPTGSRFDANAFWAAP